MSADLPNIIWVDCEMTGLDIEKDALVEIAVLVTDAQLNVLGTGVDLVIKCEQDKLDSMAEVVKNMHTNSGLIKEIPNGTSLEKADEAIITYLKKYAPVEGKSPLAGNSVYALSEHYLPVSTTVAAPKSTPAPRVITTEPRFSDKVFRAVVTTGGLSSLALLGLIAFFFSF